MDRMPAFKLNLKTEMKKLSFSPEFETVKIEPVVLSTISDPDADGQPVDIVTNPDDNDFDW